MQNTPAALRRILHAPASLQHGRPPLSPPPLVPAIGNAADSAAFAPLQRPAPCRSADSAMEGLERVRARFTVDLHPSKLANAAEGVRAHLSSLLLR